MKIKFFLSFFAIVFLCTAVNAQYSDREYFFKHYALAVGTSLSTAPGFSVELSTSIASRISLRAGIVAMPWPYTFSYQHKIKIEDPELNAYIALRNVDPEIYSSTKLSSLSASLLLDLTLAKNGLLHFTAGVFLGESKLELNGFLKNKNTGGNLVEERRKDNIDRIPVLEQDGFKVKLADDGSVAATIFSGATIKPYVGIGFGRAIPRNRVGFRVEFGFLHTEGLKLSSSNVLDENDKVFEKKDITPILGKFNKKLKKHEDVFRLSPLLNIQMVFRLN